MLDQGDAKRLTSAFGKECVRHQDSFVNSLAYYILTGRHKSRIYSEHGNHVVACQHPHKPDTTLIFPQIGGDGSLSAKLLIYLQEEKGNYQLARYTEKDLNKLQAALSMHANREIANLQPIKEEHMDWAYPVRILDTKKTGEMHGGSFDKVRNKFNKVAGNLAIIDLKDDKALRAMQASLHFWIGGLISAGNQSAKDQMAFYESLIKSIETHSDLFEGFVILSNNEPAGFTVWDHAVNDTANSLASLSRRSIKGLSEFQIIHACRTLDERGVKYYNMGGSETKALDDHKMKFMPVQSFELNSYKVAYKERCPSQLHVFNLV